ncbi:hypothetical protein ACFY2H_41620 [Streptomyces griseofuscus]|uniref:hypothetical protein n=1 Tax=Streptomyces griseofuscus TaxID=146922 RepID=UPI00368A9E09
MDDLHQLTDHFRMPFGRVVARCEDAFSAEWLRTGQVVMQWQLRQGDNLLGELSEYGYDQPFFLGASRRGRDGRT